MLGNGVEAMRYFHIEVNPLPIWQLHHYQKRFWKLKYREIEHRNRNQFTMYRVHRSAHIYCLCVGLLRGRIRLLPKQPSKIENWIIFVFLFCFYCPICEVFTFYNRLCCAFVSLAFWKQIKKATFRSFSFVSCCRLPRVWRLNCNILSHFPFVMCFRCRFFLLVLMLFCVVGKLLLAQLYLAQFRFIPILATKTKNIKWQAFFMYKNAISCCDEMILSLPDFNVETVC